MSKIDVTQIDGYAEMSVEDKLKVLEEFEIPEPDYSSYVKKEVFDKTASELAEKKRQLKDKMTEEETAKQREKEEREELQLKYDQLLRENEVSKLKTKFLGMGYNEILADETALAMVDGNTEKIFDNHKKHLDTFEKKVRAEILKNTPKPTSDGSISTVTLEKLREMSTQDRYDYSVSHPDEYRQLYGGNT